MFLNILAVYLDCLSFPAIPFIALVVSGKPKSGPKPGFSNKKLKTDLQWICKEDKGFARKLGKSVGTVQRTKRKCNLKTFRKQKQPTQSAT